MSTLRIAVLVMALAATASASPPVLETQTAGALSVAMPKGWSIKSSAGGTTMFVAQQDPSKQDAPILMVTVQTAGNTSTDDQLLDVVVKQVKDPKIAKREANPGGGRVLVVDGLTGTIKVRVGAIALTHGEGAILGVLFAKPADFDALGGVGLVTAILGSIQAAPAQTQPQAQPEAKAAGKITIADLAGVWDNDSGSVKQYATSNGQYAGAAVVSMHKIYTIAASGEYSEKFSGYQGGTATGGGRVMWKTYTGKFSFTPQGTLEVTTKGADSSYYTIVSLTTTGQVSALMLAGPQYHRDDPPDSRCPCDTLYRVNPKR